MPRFFFHVRFDHHNRSRDELGLDFPDVETARAEAVRAAKDLRDEFVAQGQNPRDYAIEVENGSGELVFPPAVLQAFRCLSRRGGRFLTRLWEGPRETGWCGPENRNTL